MKVKQFSLMYCNWLLILVCLFVLVVLGGCQIQTVVHFYDEPVLSPEQLAKVVPERREQSTAEKIFSCYPSHINIETVDGKKPQDFVKGPVVVFEAYVLPGAHDFGIRFRGPGGSTAGAIPALLVAGVEEMKYGPFGRELHFDAQAGHEYMIHFKETSKAWKGIVAVDYWIEDVNSGEVVMGEKPAEPEKDAG